MNIKDIFELQKKYFNENNLLVTTFSFIYTFIIMVLLEYGFKAIQSQLPKLVSLDLAKYPATILLFLIIYRFGIHCTTVEIRTPKKRKFELKKYDDHELINSFDVQGFLSNKYNDKECIFLTVSNEGMITKKTFRDPNVEFNAKILNHGFAIITNAINLNNYMMFRIGFDENGLTIVPHVRKDGIWEVQNIENEEQNKVTGLVEGETIKFIVKISKSRLINLKIFKGGVELKDFDYILPNYFQVLPEKNEDKNTPANIVTLIGWRKYGKIGFRASGKEEKAIITDLSIKE